MRPITKILLLLVVAVAVYLLWPRTPNLAGFRPMDLASMEIKAWESEQKGGGMNSIMEVYKIYTGQYGFAPIPSFMIAQKQDSAIATLKKLAADESREAKALPLLQQKYAIIKRETKGDFNSDDLARDEVSWRVLELDGAPTEAVASSIASGLAGLYGQSTDTVFPVASSIAGARALLFGTSAIEGINDTEQAALESAQDGYTLLKEIVGGTAQ